MKGRAPPGPGAGTMGREPPRDAEGPPTPGPPAPGAVPTPTAPGPGPRRRGPGSSVDSSTRRLRPFTGASWRLRTAERAVASSVCDEGVCSGYWEWKKKVGFVDEDGTDGECCVVLCRP